MSDRRDSPIERRVAELRFIRRPEEAEELALLEEYFKWKATDGPAKFEALRASERKSEIMKESKARMSRTKL